MKRREKTKYVHEGKYVAEVEVVLMEDESGWEPYRSTRRKSVGRHAPAARLTTQRFHRRHGSSAHVFQ